jgi:hypothetical protein
MSKLFCPHCGNTTLVKSPITVDAQGNVTYHSIKATAVTTRGSKVSIYTCHAIFTL